jgi:SET domain-containing protein
MEVKFNSEINGNGLYATKSYQKGEVVFTLSGEIFDKPTRESIYIGDNMHILDKNGMYINHSFNPSTYINKYNVIACIDIKPGDEITFDYNKNEINMACPFELNGQIISGINKN